MHEDETASFGLRRALALVRQRWDAMADPFDAAEGGRVDLANAMTAARNAGACWRDIAAALPGDIAGHDLKHTFGSPNASGCGCSH